MDFSRNDSTCSNSTIRTNQPEKSFPSYNKSSKSNNLNSLLKNYSAKSILIKSSDDSDKDLISDDSDSDVDVLGDEKNCYMT